MAAASHPCAELRTMVRGKVRVNEPLSQHTTLKIGGPADCMVLPASLDDLVRVVRWCHERGVACTALGLGSNVLAPDEGLRGVVVRTKPGLDYLRFMGAEVIVGAGASVARLVAQAANRGLAGVEGLAGVPGSVGGALVMNAGTRTGQIGTVVRWIRVLDATGTLHTLPVEQLEFAYRSSRLQRERRWLVVEAGLRLTPDDPQAIRQRVDEALAYRNRTQPLQLPNAGSIFKNPPGDSAGRLIEAAGCKGWRRGDAQVSEKHANWIVNLGQATADDVFELMLAVRARVLEQTGIALEREIRLLGDLCRRWAAALGGPAPPA